MGLCQLVSAVIVASVVIGCGGQQKDTSPVPTADDVLQTSEMRALDSISKLIDRSPTDPDLYNERAKLLVSTGDIDYALSDVGRAILMDSTKSAYFVTISDIFFQRNEPKRCLRALEKAQRLDSKNTEALYRLAQFKLYLNRHEESIGHANDMLRIDPQNDRPFLIKALNYREVGDTTRAIENYMLAAEQNPDNMDVQMGLGLLHWGRKDPLAESFFKNALAINPKATEAVYALGLVQQNSGRSDEALDTYASLLTLDSTNRNAHYNIGFIHLTQLDDAEEALVHFRKAVKVDPTYHEAIYMRGLCHEALGDMDMAKREYSFALQLSPGFKKAADRLNTLLGKK